MDHRTGDLSRRAFLGAGAAGAALLALEAAGPPKAFGAKPPATKSARPPAALPDGSKAPFDTVVVLMLENRSFDHLLGWVPGANGKQAGLTFPDLHGAPAATFPLGDDFQGCTDKDPWHTWQSMVTHYNGGKVDGWLQTQTTGDHFPIGYYEEAQVPVLGALAQNYTLFDAYHCSLMGPTWPNRFYQLCAATDQDVSGNFPTSRTPRPSKIKLSIFDRVRAAGLKSGYYHWGEPMTKLFASKKYDDITYPVQQFFTDAAAGTLPNVTFVEPDFTNLAEFVGTSNDYHPHGNIQVGEGYVAQVYDALRSSPQWDRMVFVINFDENGGFYDHVVPPRVADDNHNPNPGRHPDYGRLGFRVPAIAIGPYAPKKIEKSGPYEHASILKMIEWRWGLKPMTARDKHARNLAHALDFTTRREAFDLPAFATPANIACPHPDPELG